jgi:glycosyltransferase involved in cell wall biosynthesis
LKTLLYVGNRLSAHGYSPTSIETLGPLLERDFRVIYTSDRRNQLLRLLDMIRVLVRSCRHVDTALIDTYSTSSFYYAWVISQLARLLGVRYVPILRGGDLPERLRRSPRLCRMIFGHSVVNIAPSEYLAGAFQRAGHATSVIPNCIPLRECRFTDRTSFPPRLLWVRSFDRSYNPGLAVRVLAELRQTYPDAALCMVGPDKDGSRVECERLAGELGVREQVAFAGRLSKNEWRTLSEKYSIFVSTTNVDNTPVSVMEAMALGLPVVSTNVGGVPFLLRNEETGLLVDANDPSAMASAVIRLAESPELGQRLARNARAQAEQFDQEVVLNQWRELLAG